ncbi:MAG: MFS transporter [Actinomycetes bacterium]
MADAGGVAPTPTRAWLVAAGAGFGLLGATVAVHGAAVPLLRERFDVPTATAGLALPVHAAAALVGTVVWGLVDRRGWHRAGLRAGGLLVAAGAVATAVAPGFGALLAGTALLGAALGIVNTGGNAIAARDRAAGAVRRLNVVHAMFGVGAVAAPVVLSLVGYRATLLVLAVGGVAVLPGLAQAPAAVRTPPARSADRAARRADARVLAAFLGLFALYIGVELGVANWMAAHLADLGWSPAAAARWTSAYFVAFTVGRLLTARLAGDADPATLVRASLALGGLAAGLALVPRLAPWAYVATGLAVSPVFPTTMVWLGRRLPGVPDGPTAAMFAGSVGAVALPIAIGGVIGAVGTSWVPAAVGVLGAAGAGVAAWLRVAPVVPARSGEEVAVGGPPDAPPAG